MWYSDSFSLLPQLLTHTNEATGAVTTLLPARITDEVYAILNGVVDKAQEFIPTGVNLRVVGNDVPVIGPHKVINIVAGTGLEKAGRGDFVQYNERPDGTGWVFLRVFRNSLETAAKTNQLGGITLPVTVNRIAKYLAIVATHEIGHTVGVVDKRHFATRKDKDEDENENIRVGHNVEDNPEQIMNWRGSVILLENPSMYWHPYDIEFLRFTLPTP